MWQAATFSGQNFWFKKRALISRPDRPLGPPCRCRSWQDWNEFVKLIGNCLLQVLSIFHILWVQLWEEGWGGGQAKKTHEEQARKKRHDEMIKLREDNYTMGFQ